MTKVGQQNDAKNFSTTKLKIAVENLDQGELGVALTKHLDETNTVVDMPDESTLRDEIYSRSIDYVLYIPKDFSSRFQSGDRENLLKDKKVPSSSVGIFADNQIEAYLKTVGLYTDSGFDLQTSIKNADTDMKTDAKVEVVGSGDANKSEPGMYYFQYLPYIFICTMITAVGPVFMAFNEKNINARNKCSSMTFVNRNLQIIAGSIVVALLNWGILMGLAAMMYPKYVISAKGVLGMFNALLEVLFSLAMAYTAAQLVKKEDALSMVSNVFGLALAFLGGIFVPLEMFGEDVLKVSRFLPTYWYVTANDAIRETTSFSNISTDISNAFIIQTIYGVAILLIGMLISRMKIKEQ
jgi:ABC-2 type transport system permease protein